MGINSFYGCNNDFDDGVADKRLLKSSEPINFKPNEEIGKAKLIVWDNAA